ncbi:MAG: YeeE/YedE family protein [Lentisphaeria bacterium]|nr:YeeE/YedE family protein [Lentisphaeria bacterium]
MNAELCLGLFTGIVFGALLQQGRVVRFENQIGAMLFRDMTIFKFMLSAILVGMIGIYLLVSFEVVALSVKAISLGGNLIGGTLFGAGWAVCGYCPGTSVAAVAEGRLHAIWAVLGMLAGAALYAEAYPWLKNSVLAWGTFGKITLPSLLGVSPWLLVPMFVMAFLGLFVLFEKKGV